MKSHNELQSIPVLDFLKDKRLDVGLTVLEICPSRSQGQKWIEEKRVWVNRKHEKPSYKLQLGDEIQVEKPPLKKMNLKPYDFPIEILFEDSWLVVVNKPSGLVVHPSCGHENDTLVNALIFKKVKLSNNNGEGEQSFRPGLVHRLDKGASGLLVLAKNSQSHAHLARQFLNRTIYRKYWAMTFNCPPQNKSSVESHIIRDPKNRQRFCSTEKKQGKYARTHYKIMETNGVFSLLEVQLDTGRTHQIRVHLSSIGAPIVGDELYNGRKPAQKLTHPDLKNYILNMDRFFLHAKELGFKHPEKKEILQFNSPIPENLAPLIQMAGFSP